MKLRFLILLLLSLSIGRPALPIDLAPQPWLPTCHRSMARIASETLDYYRDEFLYREHVIDGKPWHEVLVVEEYPLSDGYVTRVVRREVREGAPPSQLGKGISRPEYQSLRNWHLEFARSIVTLTLAKYEKRRDWGPEFRKKLLSMAEDYLNDSIYVGVVEKATNTIVGGKRYILSPYGMGADGQLVADGLLVQKHYGPVKGFRDPKAKVDADDLSLPLPPKTLPEADYLGIELPRGAILPEGGKVKTGMQVEIGALVVEENLDAKLRGKIWADLHLQDLRMAFEDENDALTYGGISFHAYADPLSRRMYVNDLNWGWELLNGYRKDGHLVTFANDKEAPVIKKEDTDWVPIIFHPERMEDYHVRFARGQIPRSEYVNVGERQKNMGQTLGGAEVVESFDALLEGLNSGLNDVVAASAVGLIRLAYRQDLIAQKQEEAAKDPAARWRASTKIHGDPEIPEKIIKAMDEYLKNAETDNQKIMILSMMGQMMDLNLSQPALKAEALRDRYLFKLLADESFNVRAAALAHLQRHFTPAQTAQALMAMPLRSPLRYLATRELRRGRLHNLLLTDVDKMIRNWGSFRKQLDLEVNPLAVLEWMAETSDRLDGVYRNPQYQHSLVVLESLRGEPLGTKGKVWGEKFEEVVFHELKSNQSSVRMRAAKAMRQAVDARLSLPTLGKKEALRKVLLPLVNDESPLVSRYALSQIYASYTRPELIRFLVAPLDPAAVRQQALRTLKDAGLKDPEGTVLFFRMKNLWKNALQVPEEGIGRLADDITRYSPESMNFAEALIQLSLLD